MENSYLDRTDVLVVIPEHMRDIIPKNTGRMHLEGVPGTCRVITDKGMGDQLRYQMCGMEFRGLIIGQDAVLSSGALEYLMSRMRNNFSDKGVPWDFRLGDHHTKMLKRTVESKLEELMSDTGYYKELSIRSTLNFYSKVVGLDLSDIEYTYQAYISKVGETTLTEYPYRKSVMLSQASGEHSHYDMIEIMIDEIPKVIAELERMQKLHKNY